MRSAKSILRIFLICVSSSAFSQTVINGDLIDLSGLAFAKSPNIQRNYFSIQDSEAELQIQRSVFDYNLNSELAYQRNHYWLFDTDTRNLYVDRILKSNTVDFYSKLQKKIRSGQTLKLDLQYSFNNDNFPFNNFSQFIGPRVGDYTQILKLSLVQPLLRGRGTRITTISERVAGLYIEITKENSAYGNSYEILQIGDAYWNYYTAFKNLEIYLQNEKRVRDVLEMTKELVKADKKPAGDLSQIYADLANQEKLTVTAQQNLYNARLNLGRVVGLSDDESQQIGDPQNGFPTAQESGVSQSLDKEFFTNLALQNRNDLIAAQKSTTAAEMQYELAENNKKPQLDLEGFFFYGNASQGNGRNYKFSSLVNDEGRYMGAGAKLTFSFALNNNFAKGNLYRSRVALTDQNVVTKNLQRNIELNISTAVNNLQSSVLILERSKEALENYRKAFNDEQLKFQTGLTTLLNVILFQERLTNSELQYLQAQQNFALSILNLRHETGTLISQDAKGFKINRESYYSIPNQN